MLDVCIVYPGDVSTPRGGENRVIAFAKKLRDYGFNVHLIVPEPKGRMSKELWDVNIHVVPIHLQDSSLKNQLLRIVYLISKAKKIMRQHNMILQLELSPLAGLATIIDNFRYNYILDMHDLAFIGPVYSRYPLLRKAMCWIEKRGVKFTSMAIVVSEPMKRFIVNRWGVDEDKIRVIPNGYFESKFKRLKLDNIEEEEGMISFLGTLHLKLDINKIIMLGKSLKNSKIYIIGEGPARLELERKIRQHNLKNIICAGWLPDDEAYKFIAKSQVVIYPIKRLDWHTRVLTSVKIFDYSALGKAMVLDDVSESEIWREYKEKNAAMFSNPDNPKEFVNCVQVLLEDKKLRRRMGLRAKKIARKYTWEKMGERLVKLYKEVLE